MDSSIKCDKLFSVAGLVDFITVPRVCQVGWGFCERHMHHGHPPVQQHRTWLYVSKRPRYLYSTNRKIYTTLDQHVPSIVVGAGIGVLYHLVIPYHFPVDLRPRRVSAQYNQHQEDS